MSISNFSGTGDKVEEPTKMLNESQQIYELEETNEFLNNEIIKQFIADAESSACEVNDIVQWSNECKEREVREMNKMIAASSSKINGLHNRYDKDFFKFDEMEYRINTLKEGYESHLRALRNKLKTAIEKEKRTKEEYNKLRENEEGYKAREQELSDTICKNVKETKEIYDKIAKILKEKCLSDRAPSKYDFNMKDSSSTIASAESSTLSCDEAIQQSDKIPKILKEKSLSNCAPSDFNMNDSSSTSGCIEAIQVNPKKLNPNSTYNIEKYDKIEKILKEKSLSNCAPSDFNVKDLSSISDCNQAIQVNPKKFRYCGPHSIYNKEKTDKITKILKETSLGDCARTKYEFLKGGLSPTSSCDEIEVNPKKMKYCGPHATYNKEKGLTYRHLKKTTTSITCADSISVTDEQRQKKMP